MARAFESGLIGAILEQVEAPAAELESASEGRVRTT